MTEQLCKFDGTGNGNGEIQGSLHYGGKDAASGRDDVL